MLIGIFGTGRNGSTLIGHLLDGLEDTYVHPVEEKFLTAFNCIAASGRVTRLVEQNCICKPLYNIHRQIPCKDLAAYFQSGIDAIYEHCRDTTGDVQQLHRFCFKDIVTDSQITAKKFVHEYLEGLAKKIRPDLAFKHYLFKSIETPYILDYEELFPDMRFIHILRHPVQVCSSQKRSLMENKKLPASYLGFDWLACMLDKRWVPHAALLKNINEKTKHIIVRYEDLVKDPKGEIVRISELLKINPPPRPELQTIFYNLDKTSWGHNPSKKGVKAPQRVVSDLQKINQYKEVLTAREIDVIAFKTRNLLRQFNYYSPSNAKRLGVVRQYLSIDKWEFMYCLSFRYFIRVIVGVIYRRITLLK